NKNRSTQDLLQSEELGELRNILTEFKRICVENNIVPIFMYIPIAAHIYAEYSTESSGANWLKIRQEQIAIKANTEDAVLRLVEDVDIAFIDLTPVFESAAKDGKLLYYPFDSHWNSEGRAVAATVVAEILKHKLYWGFAK